MISASTPSFGSPSFKLVVKGLLELHRLMKDGKDDSPEAESIRDALDAPLSALSRADYERSRWLSEDLYSVSEPDDSVRKEMNPQAQKQLVEALEARQRRQWDRSLELLRRWKAYISPALLSYMRGTIWLDGGFADVAAVFFGHAAECDPDSETYQAIHLRTLGQADPEAAGKLSSAILANVEQHAPLVVAEAANVRLYGTQHMSEGERAQVSRQLIPILETNLSRIENGGDESRCSPEFVMTVWKLGVCHELLENTTAAVDYISKAIQANPNNDALLVARGLALYGKSQQAIGDLERALSLGSSVVWPYFFLAHHYLATRRFEQCRAMCETALRMNASDTVKSQLEAWRAIAMAELGFPPEAVRSAFEEALRLDPANEPARHNQDAFQAALKAPAVPCEARWQQVPHATVRHMGLVEQQHSETASSLLLSAN